MLGDNGQTWLLKPEFVTGYLQCLLSETATNIDIEHCETYCEINIRNHKFGPESVWKRVQKNNGKPPQTVKRLSFVYSCDTIDEKNGKQGLHEALRFFCLSFKKRESNPVVPLILDQKITQIISIKSLYEIRYPMKPMPTKSPMTWTKLLEALM